MGCSCQPMVKHSALSSELTNKLKITTFVFIGFSFLKIILSNNNNLLNDLILAFILYALFTQLSFYIGFFAIFFILFNFIFELFPLIQIIQNIVMGFPLLVGKFAFIIRIILKEPL